MNVFTTIDMTSITRDSTAAVRFNRTSGWGADMTGLRLRSGRANGIKIMINHHSVGSAIHITHLMVVIIIN